MPINNLTHFILVDFENVPGIDLSALGNHPMGVTIFLGPKSKLKPSLVEQISTLPFEVRLIKISQIKKNALDFVLAYHLGEIIPRFPRGHYYIVSGDKDFEPLVAHLRDHNIHISQHKDTASLPFLAEAKPLPQTKSIASPKLGVTAKPPVAVNKAPTTVSKPRIPVGKAPDVRRTKIIARMRDPQNPNRSTTLKGLRAYIKNALGKEATPAKVEEIILELRMTRVLSSDVKERVVYH